MREFLKSMREFLKSMREVLKSMPEVLKSVCELTGKLIAQSQSVVSQGIGESLACLWRIHGVPMAYLSRIHGVPNSWQWHIVGNGSIDFVTPLSPLFRIIDISHIPYCYGKNTDRSITPLS